MNQFVFDLDIPIPLFKQGIDPYSFPKVRHTKLNLDVLNLDMVNLFDRLNLSITLVEVFYSKPFLRSGIHIDSVGSDINKLNWIFSGEGCEMNWYSIKNQESTKEIKNTVIGTEYLLFEPNEVNLELSKVLSPLSLVHVGVPHNVTNSYHHRWCVSVVYKAKDTNCRPSMQQSLEIFKDFLK